TRISSAPKRGPVSSPPTASRPLTPWAASARRSPGRTSASRFAIVTPRPLPRSWSSSRARSRTMPGQDDDGDDELRFGPSPLAGGEPSPAKQRAAPRARRPPTDTPRRPARGLLPRPRGADARAPKRPLSLRRPGEVAPKTAARGRRYYLKVGRFGPRRRP